MKWAPIDFLFVSRLRLKKTEWKKVQQLTMAALSSWFISVVVITLDFDRTITFQQPRFEPGMDLLFHS